MYLEYIKKSYNSIIRIQATKFYFLNLFYWSIVDLQCYINFCCTAKWLSYTYLYTFFFIFLSMMVYHRILNIVPCATQQNLVVHPALYDSLHLLTWNSQSLPPPWQPQACSLCLWVEFCFINKFICIIY